MRILYSHYLTDANHPAARMVQVIADQLRNLGHVVQIHGCDGPWSEAPAAKATAPQRKSLLAKLRTKAWFIRGIGRNRNSYRNDVEAIKRFQPDIILGRSDPYRFSMPLAAKRAGVPLVTYADAPAAYETRHFRSERWHPPRLLETIERWGLLQSRSAITISAPARRLLERYRTGIAIEDVPNGVDLQRFTAISSRERMSLRSELGITTDRVAGFVGTFQKFHGIGLLAQMIEATASRTDLTWVLIGDGSERAGLEQLAKVNPRVIFTGRQPFQRIGRLLTALDVLVVPHQRQIEEFYFSPLKLLEGMAAGVACLASLQGDIPMLLDGGKAGCMVDSDDANAWTNQLNQLLDDEPLRCRLASHARKRIEESFTWQHTARHVASALERALATVPQSETVRQLEPSAI